MTDETARLSTLDTCTVSDALDRLGLPGVVDGLRAITTRRRIAGPVITVELNAAGGVSAKTASTPRHLGTAAIQAAKAGDVIVVAARARVDAAGWGGILSAAAAARGVAGAIVDGACRDVDEACALDFPVYARAGVPRTARGRLTEVCWNEPVYVAGLRVVPGDYVVADGSGVVFVPAKRAAEVVAAGHEIAAREADMLRRIRAGEPVSHVLSSKYETMLSPGAPPDTPGPTAA